MLDDVVKKLLFLFPPETAHDIAINMLHYMPWAVKNMQGEYNTPSLQTKLFGLDFKNPVGLAAGFDKNARIVDAIFRMGFGFAEVGTVTPKPQEGNLKPRLFRLKEDLAIINRMGFNNNGMEDFANHLKLYRERKIGIIGANIGKNKDSEDAVADYLCGVESLHNYCDYITINISSPNTKNLRKLQDREELDNLLGAISQKRASLNSTIPLLLKIAPDTTKAQRESIAELVIKYKIDGLIVSNTTISRDDSLKSKHSREEGGLSGNPLFKLSNDVLRDMYRLTGGNVPIIGVGGIFSGYDAYQKIKLGASLVQVYSSLVYEGAGIATKIKKELSILLAQDGFGSINSAVGVEV